TLCRVRYPIPQILDDAADAHAFIGDPLDPVLAHFRTPRLAVDRHGTTIGSLGRNARMMQRDDFPAVIEDSRPGRTGCSICLVMNEIRQYVDDLVLTQAHLLWFAAGMLDDIAPLRGDCLSLVLREKVVPEIGERASRRILPANRHQRIIESLV